MPGGGHLPAPASIHLAYVPPEPQSAQQVGLPQYLVTDLFL